METALGPPEHDKYYIDVSRLGRTEMHYVTHISHRMQKHKVSVTCPCVLYMKTALGPPEHEK
jgi:hypothetical protein